MERSALVVGATAAALYFLYKTSAKKAPMAVALPSTMAAVAVRDKRCTLQPAWPTPAPKAGEVVIHVQATAINRLDCNQRMGKAPVPPGITEILGLEAAGVIVGVGDGDVGGLVPGDEVMALLPGGGYAEYAAVDAATVIRKPKALSWSAAASIPEAWLTAFKLVHVVGQVAAGDVVLIHAAASGVGIVATQLVVAAGATALVTVGTREKLDMLVGEFGAVGGAVRHDGPWLDKITSLLPSGKKGVNIVLDPVASSYAQQNLDALAIDGKWVLYSLMSGPSINDETSKTFLAQLAKKRISLLATTLRTRPRPFKQQLVARFSNEVLPQIADGRLRHVIDKQFDTLGDAQAAHEYMESNAGSGKIVLHVAGQ